MIKQLVIFLSLLSSAPLFSIETFKEAQAEATASSIRSIYDHFYIAAGFSIQAIDYLFNLKHSATIYGHEAPCALCVKSGLAFASSTIFSGLMLKVVAHPLIEKYNSGKSMIIQVGSLITPTR